MKEKYILYWMQQAQRIEENEALYKATIKANELGIKVVVAFCLIDDYPDATYRHYKFMLEGLSEIEEKLIEAGYEFIIVIGKIPNSLESLVKESEAVYCDVGYLRHQRKWRSLLKKMCVRFGVNLTEVETDVLVPEEEASTKQEYMAWTLRKKVMNRYQNYIKDLNEIELNIKAKKPKIRYLNDIEKVLENIGLQKIQPQYTFTGGYSKAKERLNYFIKNNLCNYIDSNDPAKDITSKLSPYLHFGQISSKEIVKEVLKHKNQENSNSVEGFLEQIIVRRELAINFVYYNQKYDDFQKITNDWAYKTMEDHLCDKRDFEYDLSDYENLSTHDSYWNSAMKEMMLTGYMHNYMRMYWCKKIIEWSSNYEQAYYTALELNNKYFLDGRDPNSYTGLAWCFGLHDRAWKERKIFGKLRYMNSNGLERKFNMEEYVLRINRL